MTHTDLLGTLHRNFIKIEVVTTDTTGLKETAFGSLETSWNVYSTLRFAYRGVRFNNIQTMEDLEAVAVRRPDLVVVCVKYFIDPSTGDQIWLSDFFERHNIQFTGSNRATLEFDSNKSKAKTVLGQKGIHTAQFFLTQPGQYTSEIQLPLRLPLFVKPLDAANGNGVDQNSVVRDFDSYCAKVEEIFGDFNVSALVEEILPGREFTVAVLDDPSNASRSVMPVEVLVPRNAKGDRILGRREKLDNDEKLKEVEEPALSAVSALASQAFTALGARDFGRIDIKMDARSVPHFIEANLVPGMTPVTSYFPRACQIAGELTYDDVVLKIVSLALSRSCFPTPTIGGGQKQRAI